MRWEIHIFNKKTISSLRLVLPLGGNSLEILIYYDHRICRNRYFETWDTKLSERTRALNELLDLMSMFYEHDINLDSLTKFIISTNYLAKINDMEPIEVLGTVFSAVRLTRPQGFDVFLCHNSNDKQNIIEIATILRDNYNLNPWLDIWQIEGGDSWQKVLEDQIKSIRCVAVFVGNNGFGPWHNSELDAFIREFHRRKCRIIPVILRDATEIPALPVFIEGVQWIDFREVYNDPIARLVRAIMRENPNV